MPGVGREEDFEGGGEDFLDFFLFLFFFLGIFNVSLIGSLSLMSVWPKGAPLASIGPVLASTSTMLVLLVVQLINSAGQSTSMGSLLVVQEHLPSSSCSVQAPCCRPERWLPWGVSSSSQSMLADKASGNSSSPPFHMGAVWAATAFTTAVNFLATREKVVPGFPRQSSLLHEAVVPRKVLLQE